MKNRWNRTLLAVLTAGVVMAFSSDRLQAQSNLAGSSEVATPPVMRSVLSESAGDKNPNTQLVAYSDHGVAGYTLSDHGVASYITPQDPDNSGRVVKLTDQSADQEENELLKSFPVANLRGGIRYDSFRRAVSKRAIEDPIRTVAYSAYAAPYVSPYGPVGIYKTWDSPNVYYRPLYFEQANLERYGNACPRMQPAISGLHFLSNVLTMPYQGVSRPHQPCEWGLGYYRPGNCNPSYWPRLERAPGGLAAEVLTVGAFVVLL